MRMLWKKQKGADILLVLSTMLLICSVNSLHKRSAAIVKDKGPTCSKRKHVVIADGIDSFQLASYYSDHMVLQRAPAGAVLWGYAEIGAQINVTFAGATYNDVAKPGMFGLDVGIWRIVLNPQPAGGPVTITIVCTTTEGTSQKIQLNDILFGDVWVCSGQSNMGFPVGNVYNASAELSASTKYTEIRLLGITRYNTTTPLYDIKNIGLPWALPSPKTLTTPGFFSAVCWFYGRNLYEKYGIPIGLAESAYGGTIIQSWSPPDVMQKCNVTRQRELVPEPELDFNWLGRLYSVTPPRGYSVLWNAMIHPLLNMTIKGAIWYQGESNANTANSDSYKCLFPAMISSWRAAWHQGSAGTTDPMFPFGFVQLCTNNDPVIGGITGFPALRWHQTADYGYAPNPAMPNVFMATAVDLPDLESTISPVHPRDKQDVGLRLSLASRAIAYKEKAVVYQGPYPTNVAVNHVTRVINVTYNNEGSGKVQLVGRYNFEVCCSFNTTCQDNDIWMTADVLKQKGSYTILLSYNCLEAKPVALRYLWRDYPCTFKRCTVYSVENNLPALPFVLPLT